MRARQPFKWVVIQAPGGVGKSLLRSRSSLLDRLQAGMKAFARKL